ncbi:hypothetical protein MRX96_029835 [Rhipicephalus microplus]
MVAIHQECREVRSYVAAVKAHLTESRTKELGLQRPTPRQITLLPVSPFFTCSPPVPPTKPVNDPRDEPPGDSLGSYPVPPRGSFTAKFLPSRSECTAQHHLA